MKKNKKRSKKGLKSKRRKRINKIRKSNSNQKGRTRLEMKSKTEDPVLKNNAMQRQLSAEAIRDPFFKIYYYIAHDNQDLSKASFFGLYTPGILEASGAFIHVASLPGDIREPFTQADVILRFRLLRFLRRNVIPIEIDALQKLDSLPPFSVICTSNPGVADIVDRLQFNENAPFLHVSSIGGENRLLANDFNVETLLKHVSVVLEYHSGFPGRTGFVEAAKESMDAADRRLPVKSNLMLSNHNITIPNEVALASYGYELSKEDTLIKEPIKYGIREVKKYVDRICLSADEVTDKRNLLSKEFPDDLIDNSYILTVPSIHWYHYKGWRELVDKNNKDQPTGFKRVYKMIVQRDTYFDQIEVDSNNVLNSDAFNALMGSLSADHMCYTAGLSLLSSNTLTPVLRLEPRLNKIRGELKNLASCVRINSVTHRQHKQSRLSRTIGQSMREKVNDNYLNRVERCLTEKTIQGLKLVSDLPLEWMTCNEIALGLQFDVSRIPTVPGSMFIAQCVDSPISISQKSLFDILVIRSFDQDDKLKPILEESIDKVLDGHEGNVREHIKTVDVETEAELISALNIFSGAILIFDGHGSYENEYGVGTFVIGGKPIDVWSLRQYTSFPPIVIFSACDTHPIDGSHSSCANAAFTLGAKTVLATTLPIDGQLAALFIARLIYRIFDYVPPALSLFTMLTWRDVISGMLRMSYVTEATSLLVKYEQLQLTWPSIQKVQLEANLAINSQQANWYEVFTSTLSNESGVSVEELNKMISQWASMTDVHKYIQLGSPENIVITEN